MASSKRPGRGVPQGRGPYDVGCGDVMTDAVEPGVLLRLFYPIDRTDQGIPREERPPWLPSDHYAQGYANVGGARCFGSQIKSMLKNILLPARWHGQLSRSKTKYPVVIFSHGLGGCRTTYTSTCLDIASCGCVVTAVEHRDNSACHSLIIKDDENDKTKSFNGQQQSSKIYYEAVNFIKAPYEVPDFRLRQITQRRDECIASLNFLEVLGDGMHSENHIDQDFDLSQFKDRLDMTSAAICGHSFGSATTIATLSHDKRFKCGVVGDPWGYPLSLHESFRSLDQPMLIINTEKFQFKDNMEHLLCMAPDPMATTGLRQMITIKGTDHQCQTDLGLVFPSLIARLLNMRDKLHPRVAIETHNDAMIGFLSKYISLEKGLEMVEFNATSNPLITIGHNVDMNPPSSWWQKRGAGKISPNDTHQ